jgi:phosphohistidine swiveling domain-containing protein
VGLPYDKQVFFNAVDIANNTPAHREYVAEHGDELCALRLIPRDKSLPKLRMRGRTVADVQNWFKEQNIDPSQYRAEYIPHSDNQLWATIFVVNDSGIFGEIIRGSHMQLTQGFYDDDHWPHTFSYDFSSWRIEPYSQEVQRELEKITEHLKIVADKQLEITERLDGSFASNYLKGYFETTESPEYGLWFVDFAPEMGKMLGSFDVPVQAVQEESDVIRGQVGCKGQAEGVVRIVGPDGQDDDFPDDAILVCSVTTPDFVPLMQKAAAIVTDNGGILSHAAIVARELKKPCIVGTKNATALLSDGQRVVVDASLGTVTLLD